MVHSGLQFGGEPIIPGRQVHWHRAPTFLGGLLLGPQGLGLHGSSTTTGSIAKSRSFKMHIMLYFIYLRNGFSLHAVKGSPMYPSIQVQVGM